MPVSGVTHEPRSVTSDVSATFSSAKTLYSAKTQLAILKPCALCMGFSKAGGANEGVVAETRASKNISTNK